MKSTNRLLSLFAALLTTATLMADVVYEPLIVDSGFNRDVIAERATGITDYADSYLLETGDYWFFGTKSVIDSVNTAASFTAQRIAFSRETGWPDDNGNPDDRIVRCTEDAKDLYAYPDVYFKLARYDQPNALTLRPKTKLGEKGTLKLKKIGCYQRLFFLVVSTKQGGVSGDRIVYTVVHYTDGSTSDTTNFVCLGFKGKPGQRVCKTNTYESSSFPKWKDEKDTTAFASVFDVELETTKLVDRIEFINPVENTAETILAVTGVTADIAAPAEEATQVSDIDMNSFQACWNAVTNAVSYRLDVATDSAFQHILAAYNNKEITYGICAEVMDLVQDSAYYWRVRSVNSEGGQSASSVPMRVRTASRTRPETSETSENIEEMLAEYTGYRYIVPEITIHRTLCRNGYFNTLCLPFSMSAEQIAASPLVGARVFEYVSATKTGSGLDIEINGPIDHIDAGVPYLVNWEPTSPQWIGEDGLVFRNVNITTYKGDTIGNNDQVQFIGNIGIATMVELDVNNLFLGANNTLYWPQGDTRLRGFRSYFKIPENIVSGGAPARIVMRQNNATAIEQITNDQLPMTQKILRDGQIYILRDGQTYNLLGGKISY